jgi:uncharacterized heparinase superfamily protein
MIYHNAAHVEADVLLVFSQTLSFEFFNTTCGILNRTTEQKIHRIVLLVALRSNPTTKSKIAVATHNVSVAITTFVLADESSC